MPKRPAGHTPRGEPITFSAKPTKPGGPGRVIRLRQLEIASAHRGAELVDTPADYNATPAHDDHASEPPVVIDADAPVGTSAAPTPLRPSGRERGETEGRHRPVEAHPDPDPESQGTPASQLGVQTLITNAVAGWCAVVHERAVYSLQIAPVGPAGGGVFEVEALMSPAGRPGVESEDPADLLYLRVSCWLGAGKLVRTEVEPLGPGRGVE